MESLENYTRGNSQQVFLAVEILRYFCLDLGASKEEHNCVNGRRKRVKSFIPSVETLVRNCVLFLQSDQAAQTVNSSDSVFSSFFCFITSLFKCVPEEVIISVIPLVNSIVIPAISRSYLLTDCFAYLAAVADHPFSKDNRPVIKDFLQFLFQVDSILHSYPLDSSLFATFKDFYEIVYSFVQNQTAVFLPVRDAAEEQQFVRLVSLLITAIQFPSVPTQIHMISCLVALFSADAFHTRQPQILVEAVPSAIQALVIALCCHNQASSQYLAFDSCEYESHGSFQRAVSDLKKVVRECAAALVKTQYTPVMTQVTAIVATLSTQPNDFVLAFYSILKGAVEGVKALSTAQASLNHADLKSLFLQLQQFLFYGHCPFQVETLQILSVLVASVSLDPEECEAAFQPLAFILLNQAKEMSSTLENEIAKYIKALTTSHCALFAARFEAVAGAFLSLIFIDSLSDSSRCVLLQSYLHVILCLQDEEQQLQQINSLLASFLSSSLPLSLTSSVISSPEAQTVWFSPLLFQQCFSSELLLRLLLTRSLPKLACVVSAFTSIADVITAITAFSLRTRLTSLLFQPLARSLLLLTSTLASVLTQPSLPPNQTAMSNPMSNNVSNNSSSNVSNTIWTAATQRELTNQHSPKAFPFSEKGLLLFHNVMRCWKELLLNETNHSLQLYEELNVTRLTAEVFPRLRLVMMQDWLLSITVPLYLSYPPSLPILSLSTVLLTTLHTVLGVPQHIDSSYLKPYGFSAEVEEVVLRNTFASFFATLANVFLYAVGDSMRGMAMSLANRPYLLGNGLAEKAMAEEKKSDTQAVIDERVERMKGQFVRVFLESSEPLRRTVFEVLLMILQSEMMLAFSGW
ncbi:hypothetical protein WA556_004298 [Blastocystis sp. ATCC 50177/Nand II]